MGYVVALYNLVSQKSWKEVILMRRRFSRSRGRSAFRGRGRGRGRVRSRRVKSRRVRPARIGIRF